MASLIDSSGFTRPVRHPFPSNLHEAHSASEIVCQVLTYLGHYTIGGDPGGGFIVSSRDPAFVLHHAQIDYTWWIWQLQDLENRWNNISGTITLNNSPPSRNGTLDGWLDMVIFGTGAEIRNAMTTIGGLFCYIYV
jgi:tyrosinase